MVPRLRSNIVELICQLHLRNNLRWQKNFAKLRIKFVRNFQGSYFSDTDSFYHICWACEAEKFSDGASSCADCAAGKYSAAAASVCIGKVVFILLFVLSDFNGYTLKGTRNFEKTFKKKTKNIIFPLEGYKKMMFKVKKL